MDCVSKCWEKKAFLPVWSRSFCPEHFLAQFPRPLLFLQDFVRFQPSTGEKMESQVMGGAVTTSGGYVQGSSKSQLEPGPWQLSSAQRFRRGHGEKDTPSCPGLASDFKMSSVFLLAADPETARMGLPEHWFSWHRTSHSSSFTQNSIQVCMQN